MVCYLVQWFENLADVERKKKLLETFRKPLNHLVWKAGTFYGKPKIPKAKRGMALNNIVGSYSWCFFDILKIDATLYL